MQLLCHSIAHSLVKNVEELVARALHYQTGKDWEFALLLVRSSFST